MTIKKRTAAALTAATPQTLGVVGLGAKYGTLRAIRVRNWASAAKAGAGTDTALRIKITDNNSDIVYLDASDTDYATAQVTVWPTGDDTVTGISSTTGGIGVDQTGAAASAGAGAPITMESPVTVIAVNGGTATDYVEVELLVEV